MSTEIQLKFIQNLGIKSLVYVGVINSIPIERCVVVVVVGIVAQCVHIFSWLFFSSFNSMFYFLCLIFNESPLTSISIGGFFPMPSHFFSFVSILSKN